MPDDTSSSVKLDYSELKTLFQDFERDIHAGLANVMPVAAEMLVSAVQEEFDTEGHGMWPDLSPLTLQRRRKEGRGAKILQDTGRAAGSITPMHGEDFAMAFTNVPYMVFHTSDQPRSKIPLRNPFALYDEDRVQDEIAELILKAIAP